MTPLQLVAALRSAGVRLWWEGGELHYQASRADAQIGPWLRQLAAHKHELAALITAADEDEWPAALPPDRPAPVSFEQRRFLFLNELEGPADTYNLTSCFHIRGELQRRALSQALHAVVEGHDLLHTRFQRVGGSWQQHVIGSRFSVAVTDLDGLPSEHRDGLFRQLLERDRCTPFDLVDGPHLRARIVRLAAREHRLVVVMHHIVSDGHSIRLFVGAVREAYVAAMSGAPPKSAVQALHYRDYAVRQQAASAQQRSADLDYWRSQLRGAPPLLDLDIARVRPARQRSVGNVHTFRLDRQWPALTTLCAQHELTPFHGLLGAYALALARHAGVREVVVGSPMNTRRSRRAAAVIGPFINLLALRVGREPADTGLSFLRRIRQTVLDGMEHAALPFENVVEALAPARSAAHAPLFQHLFALEDISLELMQLPGAEVTTELVDHASAKYDSALVVQRDARGYFGLIRYRADLYAEEAIAPFAAAVVHLIEQLAARPQAPLASLQLLPPPAQARRLQQFSGPQQPDWGRCCLHQLFEQQADLTPQLLALKCEQETLTYVQLEQRANRFAHWLRAHGAKPGSVVGIALDHSIDMVCAVLGIAKAGAAYLPLGPDDPPARVAYCLQQGGVSLVVGNGAKRPALEQGIGFLDVAQTAVWNALPDTRPDLTLDPRHLVSILFTSGSTGTPKAVMTEHAALVNNLQWMQRCWPLHPRDRLLFKAPLTFDVSAKEIVWPLMAGAGVVIGRAGGRHDPAYLSRLMREEAVSVVHLVPTMLEYFIGEASTTRDLALRIVMCGGEALSAAIAARFHAAFDAELLHLYGPTEAAIAITGCVLPRAQTAERLPLGLATDNSAVYLLDEDLLPVPDGVSGEIFIGGLAVARGYQGRPGATAAAFLPDPFAVQPGLRMYATGDLGRISRSGDLLYGGRRDHQIKLYGQRIELGEIEAAIRQHAAVRECVAVAAPGPGGRPALKAFIVAQTGARPSDAELGAFLRLRLAAALLPTAYVFLDALPLMPNGKVDRAGLAARPAAETRTAAPRAASSPRALEQRVAAVWQAVLERDDIGPTENFFEAGGHSLLAIELRNRIKSEFGVELDVADVFAHATIQAQARLLQPAAAPADAEPAEPAPAASGTANGRIAVIGMAGRFPGADDLDAFWRAIETGAESVRRFERSELIAAGYPADIVDRPEFVPARAVLDDIDYFDAHFFGYTPMEAALLDPQHRLLLECAQWAFDDAGYSSAALAARGVRVGTFVGISNSGYYDHHLRPRPELLRKYGSLQLAMSTGKSYAATQLAFRLNLQGPAIGVDSACSTSLVAITLACQSLLQGEADLALAGAASIDVPVAGGHLWQDGAVGSRDGRCRPFDAEGSGTLRGMGGGLVLLKTLSAALRDGDAVHAVILGAASNNDGNVKVGFTAPGVAGQTAVMRHALERAAVPAQSIGFVETHGTGTQLGDPIETRSLAEVYAGAAVVLGALKGNIGHLDAAAGVAGFIKTVLVLQRRTFPPVANFTRPNAQLHLDARGFQVLRAARPWPDAEQPRRAAVSAFGIGGTNAHAILEQAPLRPPAGDRGAELFLLSAKTSAALAAAVDALAAQAQRSDVALPEISFTLATGRSPHAQRCAFVAADRAALLRQCDESAQRRASAAAASAARAQQPRIAFLFPPQGNSMDRAAGLLYRRDRAFTQRLDRHIGMLGEWLAFDYRAHLARLQAPAATPASPSDPIAAAPWQFAIAMALVDSLRERGIVPDICLGHGLGEYAAACAAGVFSAEQGMQMLIGRARLIAECAPAAFLVVAAGEERLRPLLVDGAELAASNGPGQCVVAGAPAAVDRVMYAARAARMGYRRLTPRHAAHCALVEPVLQRFEAALDALPFQVPDPRLISTLSGDAWTPQQTPGAGYWPRQLRGRVHFAAALATLAQEQPDLCLELGAGDLLSSLARAAGELPADTPIVPLMSTDSPGEDVPASFLHALGTVWSGGAAVDWEHHFALLDKGQAQGYRRAHLPGYRFDRARHWIDAPGPAAAPTAAADVEAAGLARFAWTRQAGMPPRAPAALRVCHDGSASALRLVDALRRDALPLESVVALSGSANGVPHAAVHAAPTTGTTEPAWVIVTAASLLDPPAADEQDDPPLAGIAALLAALQTAPGVLGISIVTAAALDVTGADLCVAPHRTLLATSSPLRDAPPRQFIDLAPSWTGRDVDLLLALTARGESGVAAVRNARVWRPQRLPLPSPTLADAAFPLAHRCYLVADIAQTADALRRYLQRRGGRIGILPEAQDMTAGAAVRGPRLPARAATLFLLLADSDGDDRAALAALQRVREALQRTQGRLGNIFAFVARRATGAAGGLALALSALLEQAEDAPRFLIVESALWDDGGSVGDTLDWAFDFAASAFPDQANGILTISAEGVASWRRRQPGAKAPAHSVAAAAAESYANACEQTIVVHWQDLLGIESIGVKDNFFTLGGDSLLAGQSLAFLNAEFGVTIGAEIFHANASVQSLARLVGAVRRTSEAALPLSAGATEQVRDRWEL